MESTNSNTMYVTKRSNNSDINPPNESLTASDRLSSKSSLLLQSDMCLNTDLKVPEIPVGQHSSASSNEQFMDCPNYMYAQEIQQIPATSGSARNLNVCTAGNDFLISNSTSSSSERALVSAVTSICAKLDHLSVNVDASNSGVKQLYQSVTSAMEEVKRVKLELI